MGKRSGAAVLQVLSRDDIATKCYQVFYVKLRSTAFSLTASSPRWHLARRPSAAGDGCCQNFDGGSEAVDLQDKRLRAAHGWVFHSHLELPIDTVHIPHMVILGLEMRRLLLVGTHDLVAGGNHNGTAGGHLKPLLYQRLRLRFCCAFEIAERFVAAMMRQLEHLELQARCVSVAFGDADNIFHAFPGRIAAEHDAGIGCA